MRYRDTRTGVTYEPGTEFVALQMAKNPALVREDDADKAPKAARRRTAKKVTKTEE